MFLIENLTSDPKQKQKLSLQDGNTVSLSLEFKPMQFGWFIPELSYLDFTLNGIRLCVSPNLLHQFRNQIPFGLGCFSKNNREPSLQQDLFSGATQLFILSKEECAIYTGILSGQV